MSLSNYQQIVVRIKELQTQLEDEFDKLIIEKRKKFNYQIKKRKVIFDKKIRQFHRRYRTNIWVYLKNAHLLVIITAPIIYGVVFPLVFLDLAVFIYQKICFKVYGILMVKRSDYIIIDRHNLDYLNAIEKINCMYCGYGNGLIEYIREVFARTEQYWCPIKHARRAHKAHSYVDQFVDYGDVENYHTQLVELRKSLREIKE